MEMLTMTIEGKVVTETTMTLRQAAEQGLLDDKHNPHTEQDWKSRAEQRPDGLLYVYHADGVVCGVCDGEPAIFSSLHMWLN